MRVLRFEQRMMAAIGLAAMGMATGRVVGAKPEPRKPKSVQAQAQTSSAPRNQVAEFDIACTYNKQMFMLRGKTLRLVPAPPNGNTYTGYRMDATNDLDYRFPTGLCADLCGYFAPFAPSPTEGKDAERLKTLPSVTLDGVSCRVMEMLNPELPTTTAPGRSVPLLPRVRLRWVLAPDGRPKRIIGEFQLFKPDGKTPDPNLLTMEANFVFRGPQGSPMRPTSAPPIHSLTTGSDDKNFVRALFARPAGLLAAVASGVDSLVVWDGGAQNPLSRLANTTEWQQAMAFSRDGTRVAGITIRGAAQVWNTATGKTIQAIDTKQKFTTALGFSPDGRLLATNIIFQEKRSQQDQAGVGVWNVETGKSVVELTNGNGDQLVFSPDGKTLAALGLTLYLWDTATWHLKAAITLETANGASGPGAIVFSSDGRLLAIGERKTSGFLTGFADNGQQVSADTATSIQIWDTQTGKRVRTLPGLTGPISALAFSPDGRMLAGADPDSSGEGQGDNCAVLVWDTQTWRQLGTTAVDRGRPIDRLAWTADGSAIITSYGDKTIKVWPVPLH